MPPNSQNNGDAGIYLTVRFTLKSSKDEVQSLAEGPGEICIKARVRAIPEKGNANITIFNFGGRPIKTIANGTIDVGFHTFNWDGSDDNGNPIEDGEYLCVMQAGMFIQIQHILLIR